MEQREELINRLKSTHFSYIYGVETDDYSEIIFTDDTKFTIEIGLFRYKDNANIIGKLGIN